MTSWVASSPTAIRATGTPGEVGRRQLVEQQSREQDEVDQPVDRRPGRFRQEARRAQQVAEPDQHGHGQQGMNHGYAGLSGEECLHRRQRDGGQFLLRHMAEAGQGRQRGMGQGAQIVRGVADRDHRVLLTP